MEKKQNLNYEDLYNRLLDRSEALHRDNKKRIRIGLFLLGIFTVLMILIRWVTESDRVTFMLIWVFGMFAISIYLIGVEYLDDTLQKTLRDVTEQEADLGELIPDSEQVHDKIHDKIHEKIEEKRGEAVERRIERHENLRALLKKAEEEERREEDGIL